MGAGSSASKLTHMAVDWRPQYLGSLPSDVHATAAGFPQSKWPERVTKMKAATSFYNLS